MNIKLRGLSDGHWTYASGTSELLNFYAGVDNGDIDGDTIGVFTGLTDEHGKEIYEGDIVVTSYRPKSPEEVKFQNGAFIESGMDGILGAFRPLEIEVLGNIHENPELLKSHN